MNMPQCTRSTTKCPTVEMPHQQRQTARRRYKHEVVMVGHQAICHHRRVKPLQPQSQHRQEALRALVIFKYRLAQTPWKSRDRRHRATQCVVEETSHFHTQKGYKQIPNWTSSRAASVVSVSWGT